MCYERIIWVCRPPEQHPHGYKSYKDFIRWKRLEAPKPYFDEDGYYTAPLFWLITRRVIPGLVPAPTVGIKPMPMHEHVSILKILLGIRTDAFDNLSNI